MKAYLIDPEARTITEVEHDGDYRQIYEFIDADCFDLARLNEHGDGIYVDDEGLFTKRCFFHVEGYSHPLAGKGLVLGCDEEGNSTAPTITLEWLKERVEFLIPFFGGMFASAGRAA